MKRINYLFLIFILVPFLSSCKKIEQLSSVPHIEFKTFTIFDTTDILGNKSKGGRLNFRFEDGDGDVGLEAPTQVAEDSTNLFFTLMRKENGIMVPVPDNDLIKPANVRIPYLERLGRNKILKGTISVTFLYLFYSPDDTVKYEFYLKDRNLNESNVASTSEIVLGVNKIYQ